VQSSCPPMAER